MVSPFRDSSGRIKVNSIMYHLEGKLEEKQILI